MKTIFINKVKILYILFCLLLAVSGCGKKSSTMKEPEQLFEGDGYRIALITDSGDITDKSFNQTTYEACREFANENKISFTCKKPEQDSTRARIDMIDVAAKEGYNIIIMPGYQFAEAIVNCSFKYPEVKFIALDVSVGDILEAALGEKYDYNPDNWDVSEYYNTDNTYCAVYHEEIAGYMAGYAAVKLGYRNLGFMGGMEVPAVQRYGYGFIQGADEAARELGISDRVSIQYGYGGQFYGAPEITAQCERWYRAGVEVIFSCGGGIYTSVAEAAVKKDGKIIGVDVDQAEMLNEYADDLTVTSAMKGLGATVRYALGKIILDNEWSDISGRVDNLGLVSSESVSDNYVQLAESTSWNFGFKKKDYTALVNKLFTGEITVNNDCSTYPQADINVVYLEAPIIG